MVLLDHLLELSSNASEGENRIEEGAVGFKGYGFVFKNFDYPSKNPFITEMGSSKLCSFGAFKDVYKNIIKNQNKTLEQDKLMNYDPKLDLYFGGRLKTLIPNLLFGGEEILFNVWIFVKTPKNQIFPVTFYYGQSGMSIGAWSPNYHLFTMRKSFSKEFTSIINFSPFNFIRPELEEFIDALVCSLNKVQISDFEGLYSHDFGVDLMGIRSGIPFIERNSLNCKKEETWSYAIMGNSEAFRIYFQFEALIRRSLSLEIYEDYPEGIPDEIYQAQIENHYEELVEFSSNQKSRLHFIILGVVLLHHDGKMTNDLKEIILKYSDWKYERNQLKNSQDRVERKRHLISFRDKIKKYDGNSQVKIPFYTITRVLNEKKSKKDSSPVYRQNIDYIINN